MYQPNFKTEAPPPPHPRLIAPFFETTKVECSVVHILITRAALFTIIGIIVHYIITVQETSFVSSKLTQSDEEDADEAIHTIGMNEDEDEIKLTPNTLRPNYSLKLQLR